MAEYYDRYKAFRGNGQVNIVPFVEIYKSPSDIYITYNRDSMRLDLLSWKYYGDSNYGWLILQANPSVGPYEFRIQDQTELRIPYPLSDALLRYESAISQYKADAQ